MPNPQEIPVPIFVRSLLKSALDQRGIAMIAIYSFVDGNEAKTMVSSNQPPARSMPMLTALRGVPNVEAVAKALHETRVSNSARCALCVEMGFVQDGDRPYAELSKGSQHAHQEIAQTLVDAAYAEAPRIVDPNAPTPV